MAHINDEVAAIVAGLLDEEAEEEEQLLMAVARVAAEEMMELEEGEGFGVAGTSWVRVTVNIEEYHGMIDAVFRLHFRMSRALFENLLLTIGNHLVEMNRVIRNATPLQDALLMVIWILATPDSFRSVALRFGVTPSTLHYFYKYFIEALRELAPRFIVWPNQEERAAIQETFERASGFPGIIGSIDCTHVAITAPVNDPAPYFNRHHDYSINVQAVVDCNLLVRQLHVGEPGGMNDRRIFRRSPLNHDLLHDRDGVWCGPEEHLVGDGAYVLTNFMMIPFANNGHLTPEQLAFNRRLSQNRVRVENAFARGKGKWRRLKYLAARNSAYIVDHITASFVLHNFIIINGQQLWEDNELERPIRNNQVLGGEEQEDPDEDGEGGMEDDDLQNAAEASGAEKRLLIMNHLANMAAEEEEEEEEGEEDVDDPVM